MGLIIVSDKMSLYGNNIIILWGLIIMIHLNDQITLPSFSAGLSKQKKERK